MSGEQTHEVGADGARRAKLWLERTTRVQVHWTNPQHAAKLAFDWPQGGSFSFDLAGVLKGDDLDGQTFVAEVKKYKNQSDLPDHYSDFLAKCYCALAARPDRCDHFLMISWAPFLATVWDELCDSNRVVDAVVSKRSRIFEGKNLSAGEANSLVKVDVASEVAARIWIVILSDKQECLTLTGEHLGVIQSLMVAKEHT